MDPPLIYEASFTAANPYSYSLSEIWPFQVVNGVFGERDGSVEESTVTEQSGGGGGGGGGRGSGRKRRDLSLEDEESKMVSATSNGNELSNLNVKRVKTSASRNEDGSSQVEVNVSSGTSRKPVEQSSKPEPPKDYIHVRARRGQATDSHSLAERARREKISERMKILQDLVPGCNKVIGKALVLDEIINYIQSLQRQVEILSMKLEAVNSTMTMSPMIEGFNSKDLCPQPFDVTAMMFGTQATRDYVQGAEPNWLHMQPGGTYDRPA